MATSISNTVQTEDTRTVTALMIFTVVFALIGNEIKSNSSTDKAAADGITASGRIIVGGAVATTLLALISHAGQPGRQIALSLSTVTCVTAMLVYGAPVWDALSRAVGGNAPATTPTAGTSGATTTTPTNPTTATAGAATAEALAEAA
jgi:hypothetical protein